MLGKLFGIFRAAPKAVDDVMDKDNGLIAQVGGWIGKQQYTEQEKAEATIELTKSVQQFAKETLAESTDRSKARRRIAENVVDFYLLLLFMTGMTHPIDPKWSMVWFSIATTATLGGLVVSISVFFFGSHAWSKHQEKKEK